tara:strand:+ start:1161 stop:1367 length:207 start_codon:yes stop_codon:yes gene_type:complete
MENLIYISEIGSALYVHFKDDGTDTDRMEGYSIDLFIPNSRIEDVDRNDTLRRELTAAIKTAIDNAGS